MTASEFKAIRARLGLTQPELARALRLGKYGDRTIQRWEAGQVAVTGPASVAMEYMLSEHRALEKWRAANLEAGTA